MKHEEMTKLRRGDWVKPTSLDVGTLWAIENVVKVPVSMGRVTEFDVECIHIDPVYKGRFRVGDKVRLTWNQMRNDFEQAKLHVTTFGNAVVEPAFGEAQVHKGGDVVADDPGETNEAPMKDFVPEREKLKNYFMSKKRLR